MKITSEQHDLHCTISLRGELTKDEVDQFRKTMLDQMNEKIHDIVLDMSQVPFIDSQGLESLLWLQDQCLERLGQMRLAACGDDVKTILKITRLSETIVSHPDIPAAVQSMQT